LWMPILNSSAMDSLSTESSSEYTSSATISSALMILAFVSSADGLSVGLESTDITGRHYRLKPVLNTRNVTGFVDEVMTESNKHQDGTERQSETRKVIPKRRDVLKAVGVGIVPLSANNSVGNPDNQQEIVIRERSGEPTKKISVSTTWKSQIEETRQATQRAQERHLSDKGVVYISKTAWDKSFGGMQGHQVAIAVDPNKYEGTVPDKVNGIPTHVRETEGIEPVSGCCNFDISGTSDMPAGIQLGTSTSDYGGTAFAKVEDGGNYRLMTANHVVEENNDICKSTDGNSVYHDDTKIGTVDHSFDNLDVATVSPDSGVSFKGEVKECDSTTIDIYDYYTKAGVDYLISNDIDVYSMGIASGKTKGEVTDSDISSSDEGAINDCIDFNSSGVRTNASIQTGDSGGPVFRETSDGATIVQMNNFGDNKYMTSSCNGYNTTIYGAVIGNGYYHIYSSTAIELV